MAERSRGESRLKAAGLVVLAYVVACGAAVAVGLALGGRHPVMVAGMADLAATLAVFFFSVVFNNSSFYDPYWSVAPVPIAFYFALHSASAPSSAARTVVLLALVCAWGIRLTFNWARRWKGLSDEDWRYREIRERTGRAYWPASFLSIHLFPTTWVFLGCLPIYPALAAGARPFGIVDAAAVAVTAAAIWIEAASDGQLRRFLEAGKDPGGILSEGLWARSRHPNYLGEILFWWGVFLFGLAADPSWWWTAAGPVAITLLFVFVSVPWMERRMLERRPGYEERKKNVGMLFPRLR